MTKASEPAKPGSKLALQQAAGLGGFARRFAAVAEKIIPKQPPRVKTPEPKVVTQPEVYTLDPPKHPVGVAPPRKKIEDVRPRQGGATAMAEAKTALADALQRAEADKAKKQGRPSLGEPWVALGISERTYHRRKASGTLEGDK